METLLQIFEVCMLILLYYVIQMGVGLGIQRLINKDTNPKEFFKDRIYNTIVIFFSVLNTGVWYVFL